MFRPALVFLLAATAVALAQPGAIERGKVARVDAEKGVVVVSVGGKDRELFLNGDTKFLNIDGPTPADRLRKLKVGDEVMFKATPQNGKEFLFALKAGGAPAVAPKVDSSKLRPLDDLQRALKAAEKAGA